VKRTLWIAAGGIAVKGETGGPLLQFLPVNGSFQRRRYMTGTEDIATRETFTATIFSARTLHETRVGNTAADR
jgi:hypothetical protein